VPKKRAAKKGARTGKSVESERRCRLQAADMNSGRDQSEKGTARNDPEWVGSANDHEKHAGNDDRGGYDTRHGVTREWQRGSHQETSACEYDGLLE